MSVCGQHHDPAALLPEERCDIHLTGGWVDPTSGLKGAENLSPARMQSLYRLHYPDPQKRQCS
jgi:hypothetical protein